MQEVSKIWMDGKLVAFEDANIHVLTHTLHYGGGAFEGIRFYETERGPAVFRLEDHLDRLFYSASTIELKAPFSKEALTEAVLKTIRGNGVKSGYIRPIIIYGYGKMGLNPKGALVNCIIAVWPWGSYLGADVVRVKTSKYIRPHPKTVNPKAKICGNYVNSILASLEVHKEGYDEALLLDYNGNVAEGPGENIFMVKDGKLITPDSDSILEGITRDSVIVLAREIGVDCECRKIPLTELKDASEVFFTGTAVEVTAIGEIDTQKIGDGKIGKITAKLKNLYDRVVRGKEEKFEKWLTYVGDIGRRKEDEY